MSHGLNVPSAIVVTSSSSLVYLLTHYQLLAMSVVGGTPWVLAGSGSAGFADGQGIVAKFYDAYGLVVHPITGVVIIIVYAYARLKVWLPHWPEMEQWEI